MRTDYFDMRNAVPIAELICKRYFEAYIVSVTVGTGTRMQVDARGSAAVGKTHAYMT